LPRPSPTWLEWQSRCLKRHRGSLGRWRARPEAMTNLRTDCAQLIDEIERAFDRVTRDCGVTLHETWEIDRCSSDKMRAKARQMDTDRRWQDVPESYLEQFPSALCFMDAIGFRYYIPAYMLWALRNHQANDSETMDSAVYAFMSDRIHRDKRYSLLNGLQRRAICRFLQYFAANEDDEDRAYSAIIALRMGWGEYCTETKAVGEFND
jgi:hypothetical protein